MCRMFIAVVMERDLEIDPLFSAPRPSHSVDDGVEREERNGRLL